MNGQNTYKREQIDTMRQPDIERNASAQCSRADQRLRIYFPETLDGPLAWDVPVEANGTGVRVRLEGPAAGQRNRLVVEHDEKELRARLSSEDTARDAMACIVRGLNGPIAAPRAQRFGKYGVALGAFAGAILMLCVVGVIGVRQSSAAVTLTAGAGAVPGVTQPFQPFPAGTQGAVASITPSGTAGANPAANVTVDAEGLQLLKRIRAKNGIALGKITDSTHVLYFFADPNCPHCRTAENTLEHLGPDIVPVVIPVAFLPGSDVSAATAMCSKDTAAAWRSVTSGMPPKDATRCQAGTDLVTTNTQLFNGVGFRYTPTFVADNGKMAIGETSADDLRALFH